MRPTWSAAMARLEYDAWSAVEAGRDGVAVPAQVGEDHGVPVGELRCDPVPHDVGLRIAVQQQDRRAVTTHLGVDARPVDVDVVVFEVLEHGTCLPPQTRQRTARDAPRTVPG